MFLKQNITFFHNIRTVSHVSIKRAWHETHSLETLECLQKRLPMKASERTRNSIGSVENNTCNLLHLKRKTPLFVSLKRCKEKIPNSDLIRNKISAQKTLNETLIKANEVRN